MDTERSYLGFNVQDMNGNRIGDVDGLWIDEDTGRPEFIAVKTGFMFGKEHVVPLANADVDVAQEQIRVPYSEDIVRDAPNFEPDHDLSVAEEREVFEYYRVNLPGELEERPMLESDRDEAVIPLREERLAVGKEEVETGAIRLRKVVRTEEVDRDVPLRKEEVHIERLSPEEAARLKAEGRPFAEEDVVMTTHEERPVVGKTTEVTGGVRAYKTTEQEEREVHGEIRREDVEVDRGDADVDERL